jgi:hypothetical protein
MNYFKKRNINTVIDTLLDHLGFSDWFISGSFANNRMRNPSDIDIYFYTKKGYQNATRNLQNSTISVYMVTPNASSFILKGLKLPVQLVAKHFGTPQEIFNTMDINVCKQAILSDKTLVQDPSSHFPVTLNKPSYGSFSRYFYYLDNYYSPVEHYKKSKILISKYITDSTLLSHYYKGEVNHKPTNQCLYEAALKRPELCSLIKQQTLLHAPELLL